MRYFINHDYFDMVISLEDFVRDYNGLDPEEKDGRTWSQYLDDCMDYNNGSLSEIHLKPEFEGEIARRFYDRIAGAMDERDLDLISAIAWDDFCDMISWEDERELQEQIEFRRYQLNNMEVK